MTEVKPIDPINHPYMVVLQETLNTTKQMLECLEKRKVLITIDMVKKNEYERNEIQITLIRTQGEIDTLKKIISEKENYFIKFIQEFAKDAEEVDKNYDNVLKEAKAQSYQVKGIADTLKSVKWDIMENNIEVKIHFYKRLKALLK